MNHPGIKLNQQQSEAITHNNGPMMILAGAGSGKTRTIVAKVSHLISSKKFFSRELLVLTFSNKAAREVRERIENTLYTANTNDDISITYSRFGSHLNVTTFHSFCAFVLRSEHSYLGLGRNFTIYDESESKAVAQAVLAKKGISPKEILPSEILYFIEEAKNMGYYLGRDTSKISWHQHKEKRFRPIEEDEFFHFFSEYESELHRSNAVDFGGLITGVLKLFENFPEILKKYQERYKYILIDEYQDTNKAQFDLMAHLSSVHKHICVVGDEDQSIYSWRGASINNILDFDKVFQDAKTFKLEQNYRSTKTIIDAAASVVSKNDMRSDKTIWTANQIGDAIDIIDCPSDRDEGRFVAEEISKLRARGVKYSDIAIFYRNNSLSRIIEDNLRMNRIPYKVVGGIKFYERKEIKDILAYLKMVINPKDNLSLVRAVNNPSRGVGVQSLRKIEILAEEKNVSMWEVMLSISESMLINSIELSELKLGNKVKTEIVAFVELIRQAKEMDVNGSYPSKIYKKILEQSGLLDQYKKDKKYESQARVENLQELYSGIKQYEEHVGKKEEPTLLGFLEGISLDASDIENKLGLNTNASTTANSGNGEMIEGGGPEDVSLMTVHSAKGLEFPYVFLVGVEDNVFPSYQSLEGKGMAIGFNREMAIEEERRLFYVAMTRAMVKLHISFSRGRMLFGQLKFNSIGRFLGEIPGKFCNIKQFSSMHGFSREERNSKSIESIANAYVSDAVDITRKNLRSSSNSRSTLTSSPLSISSSISNPRNQNKIAKNVHISDNESNNTYFKNSKVIHKIYGEGIVVQVEGRADNEKVWIRFMNGTTKQFLVKFAPICHK
ncbi:MAG: UvrD-helicase domain-containing protein [Oligoflexia bacterium]|nr:UvrD-helicase domain-containing protein [Oligoflexia bacterium]